MKKMISVVIIITLVLALSLTACGSKTESKGEVNVYNWGEYIDEDLLAQFEEETGIKVNYSTYPSNESMYSVLETGGASYDVIIPSDYMISRLISEGKLEKLNFDNIPNYSLVDDQLKKTEFDPTGEYSVAYTSGTIGIIYNPNMIDEEITSWSALFDPKYTGNILMFDNSRDAMGIALIYLGYDANTTNEDELNAAYELLEQQKPLLQGYVMDQIFNKLESGEAAIGPYYAGDYITMLENNPDLKFVFPEEGTNWFVDAMCIPKGAPNKDNAEAFINFMCRTDVAVANMDVHGYTAANGAACEEYIADLDEELKAILYPSAEILNKCQIYINLPQETLDLYNSLWVKLKA